MPSDGTEVSSPASPPQVSNSRSAIIMSRSASWNSDPPGPAGISQAAPRGYASKRGSIPDWNAPPLSLRRVMCAQGRWGMGTHVLLGVRQAGARLAHALLPAQVRDLPHNSLDLQHASPPPIRTLPPAPRISRWCHAPRPRWLAWGACWPRGWLPAGSDVDAR